MPSILDFPGRKNVVPSAGDLLMRCGDCHSTIFRAHVRAIPGGGGRVVELVCHQCQAVRKLDMAGCLERGGKIDPPEGVSA